MSVLFTKITLYLQLISPHIEDFARHSSNETTSTSENLVTIEPDTAPVVPLLDVDQLLTTINLAIDEVLTRSVGRVFQVFHISLLKPLIKLNCDGYEPFYIDLKHQTGHAAKGYATNPDVVFETSQKVFYELLKKDLSPVTAYMNGSLKIKGQIQDALSLKYLAERVSQLL